jgi:hypothetical protein
MGAGVEVNGTPGPKPVPKPLNPIHPLKLDSAFYGPHRHNDGSLRDYSVMQCGS